MKKGIEMEDLKQRIEEVLGNDSTRCEDKHDNQYQACWDCRLEAKVLIKELEEREAKLVEALQFYAEQWQQGLHERNGTLYNLITPSNSLIRDKGKTAKGVLSSLGIANKGEV